MAVWLIILIVIYIVWTISVFKTRGFRSDSEFFSTIIWYLVTKLLIVGTIIYFLFFNNSWLIYKI